MKYKMYKVFAPCPLTYIHTIKTKAWGCSVTAGANAVAVGERNLSCWSGAEPRGRTVDVLR